MKGDERDPLSSGSVPRPASRKGCVDVRSALRSWSVWLSAFSTLLTLVSAVLFTIFFSRALTGFSKQVNAFVQVGDFGNVLLQTLIMFFVISFVSYLFLVHLASAKFFRNFLSCCGNVCVLFLTSIGSQVFLISWVLVACFVSSLTLVYFIFIGSIYSFCALVDTQCFNFNVLIPAIVSKLSNKKIDMVFCQDKKELLCNKDNNMIWNFGAAFFLAILTFCGCLLVQNCVVYGLGKKNAKKTKTESLEMNEIK